MKISLDEAQRWCRLQILCVKQRKKGVRVDCDHIRKYMPIIENEIEYLSEKILPFMTKGTIQKDLDSPKKLAKILLDMGFPLEKSPKGGWSTSSKWMQLQDNEILNNIMEYRTVKSILSLFKKIIEIQEYTCPEVLAGERFGRIYPEYNLFEAITGRFSTSNPSIQNIPRRNERWGPIARSIFYPEEGKIWLKADWSAQEPRLQLHYALKIDAPGAREMLQRFLKDPYMSIHGAVAKMMNVVKDVAKQIGLGLSYDLGHKKMAKTLKLPLNQSDELMDKYYKAIPYLKVLKRKVKDSLIQKGYLTTLGGRRIRREPIWYTDEGEEVDKSYKALNKLIQPSGADMMYICWEKLWEAGLDVIVTVHDEFGIGIEPEDLTSQEILTRIMEHSIESEVPFVIEVSKGLNWGELKEVD